MVEKDGELTSESIAETMKGSGVFVSSRTIRRRLNEMHLRYTAPLMKPLLTEAHQEKRLAWAHEHEDFDWGNVIFTDETTILLDRPPARLWQKRGARRPWRTVKHPLKVHLWGCFPKHGFGHIFMFTKNMDAKLLCDIYDKRLLPIAEEWFGKDTSTWVLQEDNDPKHTSNLARAWREEHKVVRMTWPAQSPDQNPIENIWVLVKNELRHHKPTSVISMKKWISIIWRSLPKHFAENLVASMPRRVQALIEAKGGYTTY